MFDDDSFDFNRESSSENEGSKKTRGKWRGNYRGRGYRGRGYRGRGDRGNYRGKGRGGFRGNGRGNKRGFNKDISRDHIAFFNHSNDFNYDSFSSPYSHLSTEYHSFTSKTNNKNTSTK